MINFARYDQRWRDVMFTDSLLLRALSRDLVIAGFEPRSYLGVRDV
ncbi:MAG: hypothetical protein LBU73_00690 [Helicobacteraceae bacterium]|jgi:hypothetical protein|nr:hypothetical protein [Helicobacteraceae bacterium]